MHSMLKNQKESQSVPLKFSEGLGVDQEIKSEKEAEGKAGTTAGFSSKSKSNPLEGRKQEKRDDLHF